MLLHKFRVSFNLYIEHMLAYLHMVGMNYIHIDFGKILLGMHHS